MRYTYNVDITKMEEVYFINTQRNFFADEEERKKFNADLVIEADSEEEAEKMRMGMTDITMWSLIRTE